MKEEDEEEEAGVEVIKRRRSIETFWRRRVSFSSQVSPTLEFLEKTIAFCLFLVSPLLVKFFPTERKVKLRVIAKNGQKIIPKPKDEFGLLAMTRKKMALNEKDDGEGHKMIERSKSESDFTTTI